MDAEAHPLDSEDTSGVLGVPKPRGVLSRVVTREELERVARALPLSGLRLVILATVVERRPTPREALAWIAALQTRLKDGTDERNR